MKEHNGIPSWDRVLMPEGQVADSYIVFIERHDKERDVKLNRAIAILKSNNAVKIHNIMQSLKQISCTIPSSVLDKIRNELSTIWATINPNTGFSIAKL